MWRRRLIYAILPSLSTITYPRNHSSISSYTFHPKIKYFYNSFHSQQDIPPPHLHPTPEISSSSSSSRYIPYVTYSDLEKLLRKRGYRGYPMYQIFIVLGAIIVAFWGQIKHWGAKEGAEVATKTLADTELKRKAEELTKDVTNALLNDPKTAIALQSMVSALMKEPLAVQTTQEFVANVLIKLVQDEDVEKQTAEFASRVLQYESVRNAAADLAVSVLSMDYVLQKGYEYLAAVLQKQESLDQGKEYLTWAAVESMKSSETQMWARELVQNVLDDERVREQGGQAIWEAAKSGVLYGLSIRSKNSIPETTNGNNIKYNLDQHNTKSDSNSNQSEESSIAP